VQPDSIIPDPGNAQAWDRFAYVVNNPLKYSDPSGHAHIWGHDETGGGGGHGPQNPTPIPQAPPNALDNAWDFTTSAAEIVGSIIYEPLDWAITIKDVASGESPAIALIGLLPIFPGCVGKYIDDITQLFKFKFLRKSLDVSAELGENVWKMHPFKRGWAIEKAIGRSPNLVDNFPVIDMFENGIATSIKSINLGAKSYQNTDTLNRTVQGYIKKVANFNGASWGGFEISPNMIEGRELLLAIPPNATAEQLQVLTDLVVSAADQGVQLVLKVVR
jgi:hypothetical protein